MRSVTFVLAGVLAASVYTVAHTVEERVAAATAAPLTLLSARVSLEGTSNLHDYTASTTSVQVTAVQIGGVASGDLLEHVLEPGGLKAFDVVIPATSLKSPKDGIDKNMHKALKVKDHPDIRFRLRAIEPNGDAYRATGLLTIAGVENEVVLSLHVKRTPSALAVTGTTALLMTDYGVKPPKAMLGMVRTKPEVQIQIELELSAEPGAGT